MLPARLLPLLVLAASACGATPVLAQEAPASIGAPDCRLAPVTPAPAQAPSWNGGCKNGFADGKGTLEWRDAAGKRYRLDALFAAGQVTGEATLHSPDGTRYLGTLTNGIPDGHGYFEDPDGTQYEGDVRMGERTGTAEAFYVSGNDYKGEFKNGRRDGIGVMVWSLGGRYEGVWKNGWPYGPGKIVYAGSPAREAAVLEGQASEWAPRTGSDKRYKLKKDTLYTGELVRHDIVVNIPMPPELGFKELSPAQQEAVASWYPALAPGDEPPYPAKGPAAFLKTLGAITSKTDERGEIYVYVLVGTDGKARSVTAIGLKDADTRKLVATAAGLLDYKPAVCAGQPCEMIYPYRLKLNVNR